MYGSGENIRKTVRVIKKTPISFHYEVIVDDIIFATLGFGMGSEI